MIDYTTDSDGIATITWNARDGHMNVLNQASIAAFDDAVKRAITDEHVKGVVITSARPEFVAGGDLNLILQITTAEEAMTHAGLFSQTLRLLETSGKPFVAAINGTALGGGLEICLACHYRAVADNPAIQLGLPEVTLGLLPAAGGTQRLTRMIGIRNALPYLVEGRKVRPTHALEAGIVDAVVPPAELLNYAHAWLRQADANAAIKPWDTKGFRFPGGTPQSSGPREVYFGASAALLRKTQGLYPAPEAILSCIYDGCQVDLDTGLKIELRQFAKLATSSGTKNMIRTLFFSVGEANRLVNRPHGIPTRRYTRVGILGAGMMGSGLAHVSALAGLDVVLLDMNLPAAEEGKARSAALLDTLVTKERLSPTQREATLNRIHPTTDFAALADCQLVIEAVFEDRAVKADVTRRAEAVIAPDALLASNTSTLPITSLANVVERPERFVGMHFFSPVDRMPLVEVVRGQNSSDTAIAHALDFVRTLKKTPIVVNDCPAFYANRAFGMYAYEAMTMLAEGINPALIENVGRHAGMPMPPLALIDEFSIELLYKAMRQAQLDQGSRYAEQPQDVVLITMVEKLGRAGRKGSAGFYDYADNHRTALWPGLADHFPLAPQQPSAEEVRQRLMYSQSVEAARCVDEGIVSPRDADVGSILGWGFPAILGGVISQIDTVGPAAFVAACDQLAAAHGARYAVPQSLREMAAEGRQYLV